jgi:hypothetical protein
MIGGETVALNPSTRLTAVDPLVLLRRWNTTPPSDETKTAAFTDPGAALSRIITPDLAQ